MRSLIMTQSRPLAATLLMAAEIDGCTDVRVIIEGHSASRRLLLRHYALASLRSSAASAMCVMKVDRLSRNDALDVLAVRMRQYHQQRRDRGQRAGVEYGQPETHPASARQRDQARRAAATVARILRMRDQGLSLRAIVATLTAVSIDGHTWNPTLVARIIRGHERDTTVVAAA